jgi:hypothetical protein
MRRRSNLSLLLLLLLLLQRQPPHRGRCQMQTQTTPCRTKWQIWCSDSCHYFIDIVDFPSVSMTIPDFNIIAATTITILFISTENQNLRSHCLWLPFSFCGGTLMNHARVVVTLRPFVLALQRRLEAIPTATITATSPERTVNGH